MTQDFRDPNVAAQWDTNPSSSNPTRPEQLDLMLTLIHDAYRPGDSVLDLGFGTGIIEEMIFQRIPTAHVVGVDSSPAMMARAHERLTPFASQFRAIECDLSALETLEIEPCRFIISVQALHHLTDAQMQLAYRRIYNLLTPDGVFLLLDRIAAPSAELFPLYRSLWGWLDRRYEASISTSEGDTFAAHTERVQARGDLPLPLPRHLELMESVGFSAACLNVTGLRALFGAVKAGV